MEIRKAQRHELNILEKLARAIWPSTYSDIISAAQIEFMLSWMYAEQTLQAQFDQGHEFYILSAQNSDLGFLALEWISSAKDLEQQTLKINKLYILSQQQNKGFGKALIQKAIQRASETSVAEINLQVNKANKAKDFYAHLGFQIKEEAIFDIGNGFVMDDFVMEKKL